jgi:hypothetical protein
MLDLLGRNADAIIADGNAGMRPLPLSLDRDFSGAGLSRVTDEVCHGLLYRDLIQVQHR